MISGFWQWVDGAVDVPVIWAHQDGPQPSVPYVTLNVIATTREGLPYISEPDASGMAVIHQGQILTLSISTYGDGLTGEIQTIRDSLERITVQRALRASGLAYVRVVSGPQDLPSITGTTWQRRAIMDVQFRTARDVIDDVGVIETVAFTGGNGNASDTGATVGGA